MGAFCKSGIQQAIAQGLSAQWEPHFHPHSYGFRPNRSAHQAIRHVQATIRQGYGWVVDMDLQSFFDRVNHDRLMARLKTRTQDADVLRLINRFLKAGVVVDGKIEATSTGVPQGGPLSPLLANVVLDELDWELGRGGRRRHPPWLWRYPCATSRPWEYRALRPGKNSIHRTAGYVTRSSGGVGGRGREASSYPDWALKARVDETYVNTYR